MTTEQPRHRWSPTRVAFIALMLALSSAVLGWLIYRERNVLLDYDWNIRWEFVLGSFVLFSLDLGVVAIVWGWMFNSLGEQHSLWKHLRYYCVSNVTKRLPGTIWYIAGRTYLYSQDNSDPARVLLASGLEMALLIMSGIAVSVMFAAPMIAETRAGWLGFGLVFIVTCFAIQPRVVKWVMVRLGKPSLLTLRYVDLLSWTLCYMLVWIIGGTVIFMVGRSLAIISVSNLLYIIGSWSLTGVVSAAMFFVPSNLGITEVTLSLMLSRIMPSPIAVLIAIASRILITIYEIIWAIACLRSD
jgi:hypothetical protein